MFKKISILVVTCLFFVNFGYSQQDFIAQISLTVTDMEDNPSVGDRMIFVSEKTGDVFSATTGEGGLCMFTIPCGAIYTVKVKSYDDTVTLNRIEIPQATTDQELSFTLKYQLPKTYTLKDVNFQTGSSILKPSSYNSLDELAELLTNKKSLKIELAGYTDSQGDDASNLKLSQARADAVKNYLVKKGISASRLVAKGYGETKPIADNSTDEGRKKNRRTEVVILER